MPRSYNWIDHVVPHQHVSNGFGHYVAVVTAQANEKLQADIERQGGLRARELDPEAFMPLPNNVTRAIYRAMLKRREAAVQQAMREMESGCWDWQPLALLQAVTS